MTKKKADDADGERLHIRDLLPDPHNAREHNATNIGVIVDSLQEVGAARSIVIDENDVVLAGNGVVEGAAEAGITGVRVVEADGNEIIAVRRRGLTEEQKARLALYDNRAGELSKWKDGVLRALAERGLTHGIFTAEALSVILDGLTPKENEAPEAFPALDEDLETQYQCPKCRYEWSGKPKPAAEQ
jgi:ParB-like chromosome segregation protein Spo0J